MTKIVLFALIPFLCVAESMTDCKTLFIQPMPESMDQYLGAELSKSGVVNVVATTDQADCIASFGREAERIVARLRGGAAPGITEPEKTDKLPVYFNGFGYSTSATIEMVHQRSFFLVWSGTKTDAFSLTGGPRTVARRLVKQFESDYKLEKQFLSRLYPPAAPPRSH